MSTSETNKRSAVLYLRVASADQQDQRDGIAQQRAVCTREAERLGAVVTDEYVDAGASGSRMNRAGLLGLLRRVAEQPIRYVIVRDRTRLARSAADDATINERLKRSGVTVVSADNDADAPTADEILRRAR
jgi:DNA invertase Pin-like site-specific DNA recombinase